MKVLFCSPYKQESGFIQGGMAVWGANIVKKYKENLSSEVELIPVSFDRKTFASKISNPIKRAYCGFMELYVSVKEAKKIMRNGGIDCLHLCTSASLSLVKDYLLLKTARRYGIRSYIHFHFGRIPAIFENGGWEKVLLTKVLKYADVSITMNLPSYITLINNGYSNAVNIPNPISDDTILEINTLVGKYARRPRRIIYVGHVYREKGVWELVQACSHINDIELRIIGRVSDSDKCELLQLAGTNAESWCKFVGEVSHSDVLKEFVQAEMLAFPSYSEGFPNVILEAMASGCPIASSNVGSIPEMLNIEDAPCGICYPPRDKNAIINAIETLLSDPKLKDEFSCRAKERVVEQYSMSVVWNKLIQTWMN